MKFSEFKYIRPDMKYYEKEINLLIDLFNASENGEAEHEIFIKFDKLRAEFQTMKAVASIRYTINTLDEYYEKENDFFNQNLPEFDKLVNKFLDVFLKTKNLDYHTDILGKQVIDLYKLQKKVFSEEIIEDLKEENRLKSEYSKLMSRALVQYDGKKLPLTAFNKYFTDENREKRKSSMKAYYGFLSANKDKLDDIYDSLVKVRHSMAIKLGYKNFIQMAYDRMGRTDYNEKDVKRYRENVKKHVVDASNRLVEKKKKRLGLDDFSYYDLNVSFKTKSPKPKGDEAFMIKKAQKMYSQMSKETGEFFNQMVQKELLDLSSKKGKRAGGYCSFIEGMKMPFIFSNFNGSSGDVNVLTHEFGHSFQTYMSRDIYPIDIRFPGMEGAEIHSMSMEFLAYPWMDLFFEDDTLRYKYEHLQDRILFIPYGVSIDEFQHFVYENPEATKEERNKKFREIEKKYTPYKNYLDNEYLNSGSFWHKQPHIYYSPFYYIDYTLAVVIAFQMFIKNNEDSDAAWNDYIKLCSVGGKKPFKELVSYGNCKVPFEEEVLKTTLNYLMNYLEKTDDMNL